MRLAFDVRSEWRQLLSHLRWQKLAGHSLAREVRRGYRSVVHSVRALPSQIDAIGRLRRAKRRVVWACPRVPVRLVGGFSGFMLLCLFIGTGMRMWPSNTDTATAAVSVPAVVPAAPDAIQAGPPGPGPAADRPGPQVPAWPAPRPSVADEPGQRRAALVQAQQTCLARLSGTEPYESAKAHFEQVDARVRTLRSHDPFRELPRISVDWIEAKSDLQKIIDDAMTSDPEVVRAQAAIKQPKRFKYPIPQTQ
jgi:hypothetical protein